MYNKPRVSISSLEKERAPIHAPEQKGKITNMSPAFLIFLTVGKNTVLQDKLT